MSKPIIHARSCARKWGGTWEDYIDIHQHMDSSKGSFPDNRHRALTHNNWYIAPDGPLELIFGIERINSDGKPYSTRDVGELHIAEDYGGWIPDVSDFLNQMEPTEWMMNGRGAPPSAAKLSQFAKQQRKQLAKKYID